AHHPPGHAYVCTVRGIAPVVADDAGNRSTLRNRNRQTFDLLAIGERNALARRRRARARLSVGCIQVARLHDDELVGAGRQSLENKRSVVAGKRLTCAVAWTLENHARESN